MRRGGELSPHYDRPEACQDLVTSSILIRIEDGKRWKPVTVGDVEDTYC